ncbi:hypothetical protein DPMN_122230 [Dreissena polymorpha]|uniref:Uncharacterized protein n=1 Tax=Dreissena polymorpha TaxID=45954 RepID=A0A9D4GS16_DREPO|nr:hypothetical protein DPMN_122230 [Dreissena polymorpha]
MKCDFYSVYNFELDRDFIGTKLLTKFHEDKTINVASRVFTNQMWTMDGRTDDGQRPVTKAHLSNQRSPKTQRTKLLREGGLQKKKEKKIQIFIFLTKKTPLTIF